MVQFSPRETDKKELGIQELGFRSKITKDELTQMENSFKNFFIIYTWEILIRWIEMFLSGLMLMDLVNGSDVKFADTVDVLTERIPRFQSRGNLG